MLGTGVPRVARRFPGAGLGGLGGLATGLDTDPKITGWPRREQEACPAAVRNQVRAPPTTSRCRSGSRTTSYRVRLRRPQNPVVDAPIVGATKPRHLADAVAALDLELTDKEIRSLEEPYVTRTPTYF